MSGFERVLLGIGIAHVALLYFFVCGSLLRPPRLAPDYDPKAFDSAAALFDVVSTCGVGIAITGFVALVLGAVGALSVAAFLVWLVVLALALAALGNAPWQRQFWRARFGVVRSGASYGALATYAACLVLAVPAIIPDLGSDATEYHLAYAYDWAVAHRVYVDWWLRAPLYANNWLLIDAWLIQFVGLEYIQFGTWLTGLLSALGVYAFVSTHVTPVIARRTLIQVIAFAATLPLLSAPIFLKYLDSGMVDLPTGYLFFLVATLAVILITQRKRYVFNDFVVVAAFFVGTKLSFISFMPLILAVLWYGARASHMGRRALVTLAAVCVLLSSPWYFRNFVIGGDPIPPVLNIAVRGVDPKFTKADWKVGSGVLKAIDKRPAAMLELPWRTFTNPGFSGSQDIGVSLLILLIGLPGAVVAHALFTKRRPETSPLTVLAVTVLYAFAYWGESGHLARYSLLFYGPLAALVSCLLVRVLVRMRLAPWLAVAATVVLSIPTPASASFRAMVWHDWYLQLDALYHGRVAWLEPRAPAYQEIEYISSALTDSHRTDLRVYRLNLEVTPLFFEERGIESIGDWFGRERYNDFRAAVYGDELQPYIRRLRIGVFLIPVEGPVLTRPEVELLDKELRALHYVRRQIPGHGLLMFFAPGIKAAAISTTSS